jgi:hypothetical protein
MTRWAPAFDSSAYGPAAEELLSPRRDSALAAGQPNRAAEARLRALTPEALLAGRKPVDRDMARACLAGLWLYHDFLDESHAISQEIATPSGSYWHGILHRREGDYDNAQYWFRRVGNHPVYGPLRAAAATAAAATKPAPEAATFLATQPAWDPFRFVDFCQAVGRIASPSARAPLEGLCQAIQSREWELLFDHCYRAAAGGRE